MIGDFNEIKSNVEKKGGRKRHEAYFIPFRTLLANCGMIDFPYKGTRCHGLALEAPERFSVGWIVL